MEEHKREVLTAFTDGEAVVVDVAAAVRRN